MRHDVQRQRGLAARFGPEGLRHPAARNAPDPDRRVEVDRARGNGLDALPRGVRSHPHDGALAARLLDLRDRQVESLTALLREPGGFVVSRHEYPRHWWGASA